MTPWILTVALALSSQGATPDAPTPIEAAPAEAPVEVAPEAPVVEAVVVETPAPTAEAFEIGHREGVLTLAAGLALGVTSVVAFSAGFEAERQLRAGEVRGVAADDALTQRTVAAFVAWPAAVLSLVGVAGGASLLASQETEDTTLTGSGR